MRFTVRESIVMLEALSDELSGDGYLSEAKVSKLTPYQKAQRNRRQTVAAHSPRPSKQSTFYKHAVRAIFTKLRDGGEGFKGAAKGGQLIAQWMLKKYKYANGQPSGDFSLTSKGRKRNIHHVNEPAGIKKKKAKAYDYIMGIQRRQAKKQAQISNRAKSAG